MHHHPSNPNPSSSSWSRAGSTGSNLEVKDPRSEGLLLALAGLGIFALWRKVQADRAELDLWTEATTSDD